MDSEQDSKREPIVSPSLLAPPSWKNNYKYDPMFDLGIGEWMGDTNVETDDTKFLDSLLLFDNNTSDETGRSTVLLRTSVKETTVVMSGGEETKSFDKENIRDVANNCDIALARKRKCFSLRKPNQKKVFVEYQENWFAASMKTGEVDKARKGLVPVNTETSTRWAVKNFMDWAINRNKLSPDNPIPPDVRMP